MKKLPKQITTYPCPFCNSPYVFLSVAHRKGPFAFKCESCKACGPVKDTIMKARKAWHTIVYPQIEKIIIKLSEKGGYYARK